MYTSLFAGSLNPLCNTAHRSLHPSLGPDGVCVLRRDREPSSITMQRRCRSAERRPPCMNRFIDHISLVVCVGHGRFSMRCVQQQLASPPRMILSFLQEQTNILQKKEVKTLVRSASCGSSFGVVLRTSLCRARNTYSQGTSPASMRSPSLSS
jgi:hypothetical protein